jgi:hypothetical protein
MKYWYFLEGKIGGPMEAAELRRRPGFGPETLVCPEEIGGTSAQDWKACAEFPELNAPAQSAPAAAAAQGKERSAEPAPAALPQEIRAVLEKISSYQRDLAQMRAQLSGFSGDQLSEILKMQSQTQTSLRALEDRLARQEAQMDGLRESAEKLARETAQIKEDLDALKPREPEPSAAPPEAAKPKLISPRALRWASAFTVLALAAGAAAYGVSTGLHRGAWKQAQSLLARHFPKKTRATAKAPAKPMEKPKKTEPRKTGMAAVKPAKKPAENPRKQARAPARQPKPEPQAPAPAKPESETAVSVAPAAAEEPAPATAEAVKAETPSSAPQQAKAPEPQAEEPASSRPDLELSLPKELPGIGMIEEPGAGQSR